MDRHPFFNWGKFRHDSCLDIDIVIEKIRYAGPNYIIANIAYLNRHWENGNFVIDRKKNVKFVKEHWHKWKKIGYV